MSAQVGDKRAAEDELLREEVVAGEEDGCEDAPFADVKPRIQPSDVHVLLADDEKISRLVTSKLLRMCVSQAPQTRRGAPRASPAKLALRLSVPASPCARPHAPCSPHARDAPPQVRLPGHGG